MFLDLLLGGAHGVAIDTIRNALAVHIAPFARGIGIARHCRPRLSLPMVYRALTVCLLFALGVVKVGRIRRVRTCYVALGDRNCRKLLLF